MFSSCFGLLQAKVEIMLLSLLGQLFAPQRAMIRTIHREEIVSKIVAFLDSTFGTPAPEKLTFIEIGDLTDYNQHHIPDALYLDPDQIGHPASPYLRSLTAEVILYSSATHPEFARQEAESLARQGYHNLFVFEEGKENWISAGLWTSSNPPPLSPTELGLADPISSLPILKVS